MKRIQGIQATGNISGSDAVVGIVKKIDPPHPESPDKQHIVLSSPGTDLKDLNINLFGEHIHVPHTKLGMVVSIKWKDPKAAYLSVFDDGGRCLTLRDGITMNFREPKPGSVPSTEEHVRAMAEHYAFCYGEASRALSHQEPEILQPIATTLFLDSRHLVRVMPGAAKDSAAAERAAEEKPEPEPEKPKAEVKTTPAISSMDQYRKIMAMSYDTMLDKSAKSLAYDGDDAIKCGWRDSFVKAIDDRRVNLSLEKRIWEDIFDVIQKKSDQETSETMDAVVKRVSEKHPDYSSWQLHKTTCLLYPSFNQKP